MERHKSRSLTKVYTLLYFVWISHSQVDCYPLLLSAYDKVLIFYPENGDNRTIADGVRGALKADYHSKRELIYWTELEEHRIWRRSYSSNGIAPAEVVIQVGTDHKPYAIAVDSYHDRIYWTYYTDFFTLMESDLDGSYNKTVLENLENANRLEVDGKNGWLYFLSTYTYAERCKLDGSSREIIIVETFIMDFSIDVSNNRLYWLFAHSSIKSAALDGSDEEEIYTPVKPFAWYLCAYGDHVYFGDGFHISRIHKSGGNVTHTYHIGPYTLNTFSCTVYIDEQCMNYQSMQNEEKRSAGYVTDLSVDSLSSDDDLPQDWYRVYSYNGHEMPTFPPGVLHCRTHNPIWLNGTLPDDGDGNVTRTACVQTVNDICEQTIDIQIRKCRGYYLYYLHNTTENSSFCFGSGPVVCPDGLSSESGFYPGCSSSFPVEVIPVSVKPVLIEGDSFSIPGYDPVPSLIPVFRCSFDDVSNGTYFYDIYWYINANGVTSKTNVPYGETNYTDLNHTTWIGTYNMNMEIKCSIRSRYSQNSIPSPNMYSQVFHAGLFPDKYDYTVTEGEYINIDLQSTVPVGCTASHQDIRSKCSQSFYISQPKQKNKVASCSNNVAIRDIIFKAQFCGISLETDDWWEKRTLKVYGYSDGLYNNNDRTTYIRILTTSISPFNNVWADVKIPDIKVTVLDKDAVLKNRLCQSYNDPHITTFDGIYYDYMEVGEFVMYRNDEGPYWVHALFSNCVSGRAGAACHCGVAIRSRNSLFVVRTCKKISRTQKYLLPHPIIKLVRCDESDLLITQIGPSYKVKLPIGTEIRFSVNRWSRFITMISLKPSVFDLNKAKGLCGIPNTKKDSSDDFTGPDKLLLNSVKAFGDSWRITKTSEQLFIDKPDFLSKVSFINRKNANNSIHYCVCEKEAGSSDSFGAFNTIECNLTESTEYCTGSSESTDNSKAFYTACSTSNRRKRSVDFKHEIFRRSTENTDDDLEFTSLEYDDDVSDTDIVANNTFRNGWTEEKANEICNEVIRNTFPAEIFADFVNFENDGFIASCVTDIKVVGDDSFLSDTVQAIATKIIIEVVKNETFYTMEAEDGSLTILEFLTSFLCPSNCSDNGNCTSGLCSCYEGYIGDDCSEQISTPPSAISLPANGVCTLGTRDCKRTNIYGNFASTKVWYKLKYFQILNGSLLRKSDEKISIAEYRNAFMVTVDLLGKTSSPDFVMAWGYEISLSNDGLNFGDSVTLIIFDETCYNCYQPPVSCQGLSTCPYSTNRPVISNDNEIVVPISVSIGVTFVIIILAAIVVYIKSKHSKKKIDSLKGQIDAFDRHIASSEIWATSRQASISDLGLNFDSARPGTIVELFMPNFKQMPYDTSSKTKFDPALLKDKQDNRYIVS